MRFVFYFVIVVLAGSLQAQDTYHRAEKLYFGRNHEQALEEINQKIKTTPEPPDFLLRALIHESLGFYSNANEDFVQAIRLDEEFYEAYFHFAEFLNNTNEYEKAVASLTLLLNKIDQGETKGVFFKIDQNGLEGTGVTTLTGMKSEILTNRSASYQQLGMHDLALTDINDALNIDETAGRLVNRSSVFAEMNQNADALKDLRRAVSIAPENALAWYNLFLLDRSTKIPATLEGMDEFGPMLSLKGVEAMEQGDTRKAAELFEQALILTPNDARLLLNSGRLDFKNQQFASAQQKFERALKNDSSKKEAIYLLGNALFGQGDFKQALEKYSDYLKVDPTSGDVWFNSGMAYLELEDSYNACQCLERASDFGMKRAETFRSGYCTKE